jgi:hypothetical protein
MRASGETVGWRRRTTKCVAWVAVQEETAAYRPSLLKRRDTQRL